MTTHTEAVLRPFRPAPAAWDRWCRSRVEEALSGVETGRLEVLLPDGGRAAFGEERSAPAARLRIHDWGFFRRIVAGGEIALGEAYVDGLWDSDDVALLLELIHRNAAVFNARAGEASVLRRWAERAIRWRLRNTRRGSPRNVAAHYDLGDDLFALFLDDSMSYSSAIFAAPDEPLEAAQRRKIEALLDLADVREGHEVLEIGCGWGALALQAARRGARVTGVTLSANQYDHARRRVHEAGLAGRVAIELRDYRTLQGSFDRILSVEMIEAVGHRYLPEFFAVLERTLAPAGRVALQAITVPDQAYDAYRRGSDWLRKYIFPGGLAPSLTALSEAATRASTLVVESVRNIGPHYARTLRHWRERFDARAADAERLGYGPAFRRLWHYYLAYCEAGFAAGTFGDLQIAWTRPLGRALPRSAT